MFCVFFVMSKHDTKFMFSLTSFGNLFRGHRIEWKTIFSGYNCVQNRILVFAFQVQEQVEKQDDCCIYRNSRDNLTQIPISSLCLLFQPSEKIWLN